MKETGVVYIGIDVSKHSLDIDAGELGASKAANTPAGIRRALKALARKTGGSLQACFESTGPYSDTLAGVCRDTGVAHSVLNPYKAACFAKPVARAKTDRIDAQVIRRYAEARCPEPATPRSEAQKAAAGLLLARDAIVKSNVALRGTLEALTGAAAKAVRRHIAAGGREIARLDSLIAGTVAADRELAGLTAALAQVKGVGALTAATVAARMPEIGTLGRRRAAALAGLAPRTRESGKWRGRSFTGGGRKGVRGALFMPATVAIRWDPHMRRVHEALMARGKPYKAALTAVMRRLIIRLDAVARAYRAGRGGPG